LKLASVVLVERSLFDGIAKFEHPGLAFPASHIEHRVQTENPPIPRIKMVSIIFGESSPNKPERHVQAVLSTSPNLKAKLVSKVQVILLKWVAGSEQLEHV